jgi:hypothetical protein
MGKTGGDRTDEENDLATLLADPHCRYVVEYLRDHERTATVESVSRYVIAQLTDTSRDAVPEDVQRRVQTWLHHGQLPELDDYGLVTFDPESGIVRRGTAARR